MTAQQQQTVIGPPGLRAKDPDVLEHEGERPAVISPGDRRPQALRGAEQLEGHLRIPRLPDEDRDVLEQEREGPAVVVVAVRPQACRVVLAGRGVIAEVRASPLPRLLWPIATIQASPTSRFSRIDSSNRLLGLVERALVERDHPEVVLGHADRPAIADLGPDGQRLLVDGARAAA